MADNNTEVATEAVAPVEAPQAEAPQQEAPQAEAAPAPAPAAPTPPARPMLNGDLSPDLQVSSSDEPRKEVEGGRSYEITYIVIANNPEALDKSQASLKSIIDENGGAVDNVRVSEVRRLSYPIAKRTEGIYVVANARFQKQLTEELDRHFKLDEAVLRHIILRDEV